MELRDLARRILEGEELGQKLEPPPDTLTDDTPGPPFTPAGPARSSRLTIVSADRARTPSIEGMSDPAQRVRILHAFANHELQAIELFAFALAAFPETPGAFRRGLSNILSEEQIHCRLYVNRLEELGVRFGDLPVSGYFWSKVGDMTTPQAFLSAMSLTFESANLDHSLEHARAARSVGDERTAEILDRVYEDEIRHVRFGCVWLDRLEGGEKSLTESYLENIRWPLRPALAKGSVFHPESRRRAGMDEELIRRIADSRREER